MERRESLTHCYIILYQIMFITYTVVFSDLGFGVVDVDYEYNVVKRLKIPRIPSIGAVFNGRSVIFDAEEYSVKNLRDFTRRLLPADLLQQVCFTKYLLHF